VASISLLRIEERHKVSGALLTACWSQGKDISDESVVASILDSLQLEMSGESCIEEAASNATKDTVRLNTQMAINAGIFGVPTTQVGNEIFFGGESETLQHIEDMITTGKDVVDPLIVEHWRNLKKTASRI